jgi:hypothetical protein
MTNDPMDASALVEDATEHLSAIIDEDLSLVSESEAAALFVQIHRMQERLINVRGPEIIKAAANLLRAEGNAQIADAEAMGKLGKAL